MKEAGRRTGKSAVKSLLLLRRNDMKQERGKEEWEGRGAPACSCETSSCFPSRGQRRKIVFVRKKSCVMFCVGGVKHKRREREKRRRSRKLTDVM